MVTCGPMNEAFSEPEDDNKLFYAEIAERDDNTWQNTGDNITLSSGLDGLIVTVECPWDGDSITGFGSEASVTLSNEKVRSLISHMQRWLDMGGI